MSWGSVEVPPAPVVAWRNDGAVWMRAVCGVRDARNNSPGEKNAENMSGNVEIQVKNAIFAASKNRNK